MASQPLSERDVNLQHTSTSPSKDQTKTGDAHKQTFESRLMEDRQQKSYVSPSDNILSPASQKLAAFKNKRNERSAKPRSLFAKTMDKKANMASQTGGFADIQQAETAAKGKSSES